MKQLVLIAIVFVLGGCSHSPASSTTVGHEGAPAASTGAATDDAEPVEAEPRDAPDEGGVRESAKVFEPTTKTRTDCDVIALSKVSDVELEHRSETDPCAAGILGSRLLGQPMRQETFVKGAELLRAAHDQGVYVSACLVFYYGVGMGRDLERAAECFERSEAWNHLAFMVATGQGRTRDLGLAEAILERVEFEDCTTDSVRDVIEAERRNPGAGSFDWCEHGACTTIDSNECMASDLTVYEWQASQDRQKLLDRELTTPAERAAYERLEETFTSLVDADREQVYLDYVDGTIRNAMALERALLLSKQYNSTLQQVLGKRSLPPVTTSELTTRQKALDHENDLIASADLSGSMYPELSKELPAAHRRAKRAWKRHVEAWRHLAKMMLKGPSSEISRSIEGHLVEARVAIMRKSANP